MSKEGYRLDIHPSGRVVQRMGDGEIVQSVGGDDRSKPATEAYRDGWDRIFGGKEVTRIICEKCHNDGEERICPYAEDVLDRKEKCTCCKSCAQKCADDI